MAWAPIRLALAGKNPMLAADALQEELPFG
jgi:hypothetical protein